MKKKPGRNHYPEHNRHGALFQDRLQKPRLPVPPSLASLGVHGGSARIRSAWFAVRAPQAPGLHVVPRLP
uniref:Uncharacterized protein n=1 Tax=Arundo donax TaxID=35708 RepID=A0A0A9BX94_ARUDO